MRVSSVRHGGRMRAPLWMGMAIGAVVVSMSAPVGGQRSVGAPGTEDELTKKARAIHGRVMTLDTHNDIDPANFTAERNYTQDLGNQVNLPKMFAGGLDASFFIVYVGQDRSHLTATTTRTSRPSRSSTPSIG